MQIVLFILSACFVMPDLILIRYPEFPAARPAIWIPDQIRDDGG
jgi:hypothetical protein